MRACVTLLALSSCFYVTEDERAARFDLDGDGIERPFDCDDDDPRVGEVATRYADGDGDGYGDPDAPVAACGPEPGTVDDDTDCDDTQPTTFPGARELCDGEDNDCDAETDEGRTVYDWYPDLDGDGFGDPEGAVRDCRPPLGYLSDGRDCDDDDAAVNPDAEETCADGDEDCDGLFDEGDPGLVPDEWYADDDEDGFGAGAGVPACEAPVAGMVVVDGDCDDDAADVNPDADERCTAPYGTPVDENCDGVFDTDAVDRLQYYTDADGDGFGDATAPVDACPPPGPGLSVSPSDCDDGDADVFPGQGC
jgi:hypothetical protein